MSIAEIFVLVALVSGTIVLWWPNIWLRTISFIFILSSIIFIWQFSLGHPRTIYAYNLGFPAGQVLSSRLIEPKSIYLWVLPQDSYVPVYVELHWTLDLAKQLQKAQEKAKGNGTAVLVKPTKGLFSKVSFGALQGKNTGGLSLAKIAGWFGYGKIRGHGKGGPGQAPNPVFYSGVPNSLGPKAK